VVIRFCALLCAVLVAGCASVAARRAHERALEQQLGEFQSARSLDDGWQEARRLLAERGYPLAAKDAAAVGQEPMGWAERIFSPARETAERGALERSLDTGWSRARDRYRLESRPNAGGWRVIFSRIDEALSDRPGQPSRDLELELALVRRVDPEAAARIDQALPAPAAPSR
jgi:hypothetical protein